MTIPKLPKLIKIGQTLPRPVLADLAASLKSQLAQLPTRTRGARVALAVGSRGISDLVPVVRIVSTYLSEQGYLPFVVAAMGSHGGGTVAGQLAVLDGYGISEATLGIPVQASTETVAFAGTAYQGPVLVNDLAWEADGIVLINRVKTHTDIQAELESGLAKMIAIGLGNREQAESLHHEGLEALSHAIPLIAEDVLASGKVWFGVAVVENAYAETACVEVLPPESLLEQEKRLLRYSKELAAALPVAQLDVLVIDRGGKDFAGSCIDTHVIGRMALIGERDLDTPRIHRVVVCDLSDHSQGNAAGIGLADFITRRFFNKIDFPSTYTNCISCIFPERGKLPVVMETDGQAILTALETCRTASIQNPRIIRIPDTLHVESMYVSAAVYEELSHRAGIETLSDYVEIVDKSGNLIEF
jgi:hypothetical protein